MTRVLRRGFGALAKACGNGMIRVPRLFCQGVMAGILIAAGIAVCGLAAAGPLLFRWYVREVRRLAVQQLPGEATISYPLA